MNEKSKGFKKMDFAITAVLLIGILAVVNYFANNIFARWDLTQSKIYSISRASKDTVADLDDVVNIKAYFSENLPPYFMAQKQEVSDLLNEYRVYSNGKIKVTFIDPKDDEGLKREAGMLGIPQLTFDVRERDEMKLSSGYMGIAINYGADTEVIPAVKSGISNLEYQITSAIKKVTSEDKIVVGYLTSHDTLSMEELSAALKEIENLYDVMPVELSENSKDIPDNIDTLIIAGPKGDFEESQFKSLNSFLKRGGSLFVMADGVQIADGLMASKTSGNFNDFLEKYGLKVNNDLVVDVSSNARAQFQQGFFPFMVDYPFWPVVNKNRMNGEFSAVSDLESLMLPWASSISIDEEKTKGKAVKLAESTDKAYTQKENYNVLPNMDFKSGAPAGKAVLAAALFGDIDDPYAEDEKIPFPVKIALVGDSDFITGNFIRNYPDNMSFFQNMVDSLSLDDSLITIRSKGATIRPIANELSPSAKTAVKYANILGVTILVMLFGLLRYFMRRKSRFVDEL
jgi:gliding-associated putative ABC transporter substrate-binding component GldG